MTRSLRPRPNVMQLQRLALRAGPFHDSSSAPEQTQSATVQPVHPAEPDFIRIGLQSSERAHHRVPLGRKQPRRAILGANHDPVRPMTNHRVGVQLKRRNDLPERAGIVGFSDDKSEPLQIQHLVPQGRAIPPCEPQDDLAAGQRSKQEALQIRAGVSKRFG